MKPVLDLTKYAFRRQLGDIILYGTWIGESVDDSEPCLVLISGYRNTKPCCIALSAAYRYDDPNYLLYKSIQFNKDLGFTDNMSNVHRVASVIHDHLQDLIELPPRPVLNTKVGAEAVVTDSRGRKSYAEILDFE